MNEAFLRTQMLLGADALDKLSRCHVIVFGLGGVGSYAAESQILSGCPSVTDSEVNRCLAMIISPFFWEHATKKRSAEPTEC